jgi:hypothetical protein
MRRWRLRERRRALPLELAARESQLAWGAPATLVCVAGAHGGAGASTLTLLLCELIASAANAPVLAVDLAGHSRGGLAVLSGVAGQTTAEGAAAAAVIHDAPLERPFGVGERGVHVLGASPDGVLELDRTYENLAARLATIVVARAEHERPVPAFELLAEARVWEALRWDNEEVAGAIGALLDRARPQHSLVAVDLGMRDSDRVAKIVQARSTLLLWVLPGRATSLEIARRRLPHVPVGDCLEAIVVWESGRSSLSARRLSELGHARGCPVVRLANHGEDEKDGWPERAARCLSGLIDLCELAR